MQRHTLYGCVDWNHPVCMLHLPLYVTPCMGVWIETSITVEKRRRERVTPCMGVWIETFWAMPKRNGVWGHTLYGCVDWNTLLLSVFILFLSHTLYGCVDWNTVNVREIPVDYVTPCMGVWIETSKVSLCWLECKVTPCMGVWIETSYIVRYQNGARVTPCMGVWIETANIIGSDDPHDVTPCMGVWIETLVAVLAAVLTAVTPCMGVWIETVDSERETLQNQVTPCMGVWIETEIDSERFRFRESHPVWVCGLKLYYILWIYLVSCHTLYGCVDWNWKSW